MDPNENTQAEIYANIRDKALEEAAKVCELSIELWNRPPAPKDQLPAEMASICAKTIRKLKRNPNG